MIRDTSSMLSGPIAADGSLGAQPITSSALSTNVIDLRNTSPVLAQPEGLDITLWLIVQVTQTFNNLTSLQIEMISDGASNLITAPVSHFSITVPLANLTAGAFVVRTRIGAEDIKRWLGLRYTVNGAAPTSGAVIATFADSYPRNTNYPSRVSMDA